MIYKKISEEIFLIFSKKRTILSKNNKKYEKIGMISDDSFHFNKKDNASPRAKRSKSAIKKRRDRSFMRRAPKAYSLSGRVFRRPIDPIDFRQFPSQPDGFPLFCFFSNPCTQSEHR